MKVRKWFWAGLACAACAGVPRRDDSESAARWAIADVYARFAEAVNRHDWNTMAELHSEGAIWEAQAGELGFHHRGRQAIRAWLIGNVPRLTVVHYLSGPPVVRLTGPDRAEASVSVTELLRMEGTGELKQLFGVYTDELALRDGRWSFTRRRFVLHQELKR